ncbi:response regulator [Roseibium sp. FZY0029]|uniref:response regulator n=1 Tax=Roseibium sp. FZY0029 TaxID=3116647 RepID=UPI002ED36814
MSLSLLNNSENIKVIVAEDEPLIAWMLEDALSGMGLEVVGPFATVAEARTCALSEEPQLAVLDVDLADGVVYPLADALHEKNVPLIFHTANTDRVDLKGRYDGSRVVLKPSNVTLLQSIVEDACSRLRA